MSKKRIKKTKLSSKSNSKKLPGKRLKQTSRNKSNRVLKAFSKNWKNDKFEFLFFITAILVFLFFGLHHISEFFTTDETAWLNRRYPNFWNSIQTRNWSNTTNMNAQAGILQMILSGNAIQQFDLRNLNPENFQDFLFAWRSPLVIFNFLCLPFIYFLTRSLVGKKIALAFIILLTTFPFLIGISQVFGKDSVMWSTGVISILAFFNAIKSRKYSFSILSGIFLGLSITSKFPATLLIPFYFLVIYLEYLFKQADKPELIRLLKQYAVTVISMFLVVYILIPACWFDLQMLIKWTLFPSVVRDFVPFYLSAIFFLIVELVFLGGKASNWIRQKIKFDKIIQYGIPSLFLTAIIITFFVIIFDVYENVSFLQTKGRVGSQNLVNDFLPAFFSGFRTIVSSFPHLVFIGFFGSLITILFKPVKLKGQNWMLYLFLFIFIYYLGASISGAKLGMRYQSLLIPCFTLLAAFFYGSIISKKLYVWTTLLLIIGLLEVIHVSPFYLRSQNLTNVSSYMNPGVGWGMGGYEMAEAMNADPNVKNVRVFCDYEGFKRFFKGNSVRYDFRQMPTQSYLDQFDYLFLSSSGYSQMSRNNRITPELQKYYDIPLEDSWAHIGRKYGFVRIVPVR